MEKLFKSLQVVLGCQSPDFQALSAGIQSLHFLCLNNPANTEMLAAVNGWELVKAGTLLHYSLSVM